MLQSIKEYPWLYALLAVFVAVCLFAWAMAMRASHRHQAQRDKLIAELDRQAALRRDFAAPTPQQLADTSPERLIEGLCMHMQADMDGQDDLEAAFAALTQPQRRIYALGYVVQDSRERLSDFFRNNGEPLAGAALEAVQQLIGGEYYDIFHKEYDAFDETNETASLLKDEIAACDERFSALAQEYGEARYGQAKDYISANSADFTQNLQ